MAKKEDTTDEERASNLEDMLAIEDPNILDTIHSELSSLFISRSNARTYRKHLEAIDKLLGLDKGRYFPSKDERLKAIRELKKSANAGSQELVS